MALWILAATNNSLVGDATLRPRHSSQFVSGSVALLAI